MKENIYLIQTAKRFYLQNKNLSSFLHCSSIKSKKNWVLIIIYYNSLHEIVLAHASKCIYLDLQLEVACSIQFRMRSFLSLSQLPHLRSFSCKKKMNHLKKPCKR